MPDTPTTDRAERHLDERIRALVAAAVADAPPAPHLDAVQTTPDQVRRDRARWLIVGTALVGAAAAVIALVAWPTREDASIGPAAPPTVLTTAAPAPATTVPAGPPGPTTTGGPGSGPADTASSVVATTVAAPAPAAAAASLASADGEAISLWDAAGNLTDRVPQAADVAFALGDGRVLAQRRGEASDGLAPADTTPWVWTGSAAVPVALTAGDTDYIEVHDVALIDGRPVVLYTTAGPDANPDTLGDVHLWAASIDDAAASADAILAGPPVDLGVVGGWEAAPERLHLASTGLVVGALSEGPTHRLFVTALPGSAAAATTGQLTPGALGLEEQYTDCAACPRLFAVDGAGTTLAWVDGEHLTTVPIGADGAGPPSAAPLAVPSGNLASIDLVDGGGYVATYADVVDPRERARLVTATGTVIEDVGLDVTWAPSVPGPTG